MKKKIFLSALCLLALTCHATESMKREFIHIAPKAVRPPVIDGKLDDECWKKAPVFKAEMRKADEKTNSAADVQIVWDDRGIYVAILNYEKELNKLKTLIKSRDGGHVWADDCNEFFFFPVLNPINYYKFEINSLGVFGDWYRLDFNMQYPDWNAMDVKCASGRTDKGWTIEFFLSWKDMNIQPKQGDFVGFMMTRFVWKDKPWLTKNSTTGGGYYGAKPGYVYLDASAPGSTLDAARKMLAINPAPWYVAEDPAGWVIADKNGIRKERASVIVDELKKEAENAIASAASKSKTPEHKKIVEQLKKRLQDTMLRKEDPAVVSEYVGIRAAAKKLQENIELHNLFQGE